MAGGRPRKPTALHILEGTYREDRHADRKKEPAADGPPVKPDWLVGEALRHWEERVPGLIERGLATEAHSWALVQMCEWWAEWRRLGGGSNETKMPGRVYAMKAAFNCWRELDKHFGGDPVSQAKVAADVEAPDDIASEFGFG